MAHVTTDTPNAPAVEGGTTASLVDWGAVIAGALLAAALSFVLLTFGTSIGLSATSPWPGSGLSARVIGWLAVFWTLAQQIAAFLAGGYVAGRLRSRWRAANTDEAEFRDGLHGGLVWALGIALGTLLALAATSALTRAGTEVGARAAGAIASAPGPTDLALDALLRPGAGNAPAGRAESAGADVRAELGRLLASTIARGGLSDQDRSYLTQRVSQLTGLSQQEADTRIKEAVDATRRAADTARRTAVLTGLVTATSLLASLAAAWWAAIKGGQHRDNSVPPRFGFGQPRRRIVAGS